MSVNKNEKNGHKTPKSKKKKKDSLNSKFSNPPSYLEHENMKFLIFDSPNDDNLQDYIEVFEKYNVKTIVRVCDPTYSLDTLIQKGYQVSDMPYADGASPPKQIVQNWLSICKKTFKNGSEPSTVGVHCVAGLGRAPALVVIALIESGMEAIDAIQLVRSIRRGAINAHQLEYLRKYKRSSGCSIL